MTTPKRAILGGLAVFFVGTVAFVAGRYVFSEEAPIEAQVDPSGTPVVIERPPHPSIAARMTAVAEDNQKPLFTGELNGITFIGEGTPFPEEERDCSNTELRELHEDEARSAISDSALDYRADGIPAELQLVSETATVCKAAVVSTGRVFAGDNNSRLSIVRTQREPVFTSLAPRDRLEPVSLGGRNAVVVKSLYEDDLTMVLMHDEEGTTWAITAELISEDEVRQIVEDVR